ncbi:MAG: hypothetical protein LBT47_02565 [Deltaproteobacteria bacterium]|jgi:hypothetical protein|nr:hypothetical protein [Deltaproteobacteria bacterium]
MPNISRLGLSGLVLFFAILLLSPCLWAQSGPTAPAAAPDAPSSPSSFPVVPEQFSEAALAHHLNTIGTYSAGFVLQSYGYIGVLADVFSQNIYDPSIVRSMLGETITYLNNARKQLVDYQTLQIPLSKTDLSFIDSISDILADLLIEAEALRDFTESHKADDLKRFNDSRQNAWTRIKKLLDVK